MTSILLQPPLKFLSFGAGAIGTYIGGSLALKGHTVVFLERPEAAASLGQHGLHLQIHGREEHLPHTQYATSLVEALEKGPFEAGLFALKSFDTRAALEEMAPYRTALPPILCLQNGVENEGAISEVLGANKVIAGTVTSAVGRRGFGDIVLERLRGMGVAAGNPLSHRLATALDGAGLNARLFVNAADMKWSKLLTNLLANATSAILNMSPAEIFLDPRLVRLEVRQLRETLAVMAAQEIQATDLPGTPVRLLAFGVRTLPLPILRPFLRKSVGSGRGGKMPSFHIDLYSGRGQSEVDYLNGAVVRFGERCGVQTPVNRTLTQTLLGLTRGELAAREFDHQPERLIGLLQ